MVDSSSISILGADSGLFFANFAHFFAPTEG